MGYELSFDGRVTLDQVDTFLDRMAQAFREDQREPPDLSPTERQLLAVLDSHRELLQYRLLDELVWTVVRLLEGGAELVAPPTLALVDEYQDLTAGELRLLHLLAQRHGTRVIACGDDRQSIFGFRDADRLALHRFADVYGIPEVDFLSRSRRCAANICQFAENIAAPLPPLPGLERPPLTPWQEDDDAGEIRLVSAPSPIGEARWVVEECKRLVDQHGAIPADIMIVVSAFRSQVARCLQDAIQERDDLALTIYDPVAVDPLAEALSTRLLSVATRLLSNSEDQLAWRSLVWATPGLGDARLRTIISAGETTYLRNLRTCAERDATIGIPYRVGTQLIEQFGDNPKPDPRALIEFLCQGLGVEVDGGAVNALVGHLEADEGPKDWAATIFELSQKTQVPPSSRPTDIPMRTVFGAKGLEADTVFVVNAIPQAFSAGGDAADGIRRLYVAATRARRQLYISAPRNLRYTALGHAAGAAYGGLAQTVTNAAAGVGLQVESVG